MKYWNLLSSRTTTSHNDHKDCIFAQWCVFLTDRGGGGGGARWLQQRSDAIISAMSPMEPQGARHITAHTQQILTCFQRHIRRATCRILFSKQLHVASLLHNHNNRYSPKSRNCFMERGEGENLEKCSICLGTLANAAFFIINLTNFIFAGGVRVCWTADPMLGFPRTGPGGSMSWYNRAANGRGADGTSQWESGIVYLSSRMANGK